MGAAIVEWRHLPAKIILDLVWLHMWKTIKKRQKLPLTINFFLGTQLVQIALRLYYIICIFSYLSGFLSFRKISSAIRQKPHTQTMTDHMWRRAIIMLLDGRSVVSVTQVSIVTNFNLVHFLLSRL